MLVEELLTHVHKDLLTIDPEETVGKAAALLADNDIGALPVCDPSGNLIGIISERDIIRGFTKHGGAVEEMKVSALMTKDVITCGPKDGVHDIMETMNDRHFRHLPVLDGGKLTAILSLRDVMASALDEAKHERNVLANAYELVRTA